MPSWMRSGHSFPPLRAGLVMYLTRNLTPEASGALQADQSVTMHGSGTVIEKKHHTCHFHGWRCSLPISSSNNAWAMESRFSLSVFGRINIVHF